MILNGKRFIDHGHDKCDQWFQQRIRAIAHQCNLKREHKGKHICKCGVKCK